jgi:GH18 family chitinase
VLHSHRYYAAIEKYAIEYYIPPRSFDPLRTAVSLYDPALGTFYTYDNPTTAFLKMLYVDLKVPGGLGGAYVWALKDDDAERNHGEDHGERIGTIEVNELCR